DVPPFDQSHRIEALVESGHHKAEIAGRQAAEKSDHRHRRRLSAGSERPRCCRASESGNELAPVHSITSSARASSVGGTSMPRAFAVLRLITSSYLVGACTGRSAGFSPLKMRSAYFAAR